MKNRVRGVCAATGMAAAFIGAALLVGPAAASASSVYYVNGSTRSVGKCKVWLNGKGQGAGRQIQGVAESWGDRCDLSAYDGQGRMLSIGYWSVPRHPIATRFYSDKKGVFACIQDLDIKHRSNGACTPTV